MARSIAALQRQRQKLLAELVKLGHWIRASFFQRFSTCTRPRCACHKGQRHGPRAYLSIPMGRKQRQIYVPTDRVNLARQTVQQYQRLTELVERISQINLQLFKRGALDADPRKAPPPPGAT